ncbi:protein of unknown function [Clostridium beijerinckii]|nr:protein of unknown function [Clostridium beijerinckii]
MKILSTSKSKANDQVYNIIYIKINVNNIDISAKVKYDYIVV